MLILFSRSQKKRRRAKNRIIGRFGGYDVDDPFVDDSEIAFYEVSRLGMNRVAPIPELNQA